MKSHFFRGTNLTGKTLSHGNVTMPTDVYRSNQIAQAAAKDAQKQHSFPIRGQRVREFAEKALGWQQAQ